MQAEFLLRRELNNNLVCVKQRNTKFYPHFHSHIEIYLVISGEFEVLINDRRKKLRSGELSVAFSYDVHSYNSPNDTEVYCLIIPPIYFDEFLPLLSSKHEGSPFIDDRQTYETVKKAMERLMEATNAISKQGYVYVILGEILNKMPIIADTETPDMRFSSDILIYVSQHFREELTLPMLAARFGYNPSYLSRNFHNTFGISFGKYLTMLRLREAVLLLHKNEMNITDCALESGFGSLRSFYRAFRDEFDCSPKEYLNRERQKPCHEK